MGGPDLASEAGEQARGERPGGAEVAVGPLEDLGRLGQVLSGGVRVLGSDGPGGVPEQAVPVQGVAGAEERGRGGQDDRRPDDPEQDEPRPQQDSTQAAVDA